MSLTEVNYDILLDIFFIV